MSIHYEKLKGNQFVRPHVETPHVDGPPSLTLRPRAGHDPHLAESPLQLLHEDEALATIAAYVEGCKNGTNVVSFIGLDGSGKTTLCSKVAPMLDSGHTFLNLEGYLLTRKERRAAGISPWHPAAFDHESAIRDITSLLTDGHANIPHYSHQSGEIEGISEAVLDHGAILLTDELTAIHLVGALRAKPHYVYVSTNDAIRWQRVWQRNRDENRGFSDEDLVNDFKRKYDDFVTYIANGLPQPELLVDTTGGNIYGVKHYDLPGMRLLMGT